MAAITPVYELQMRDSAGEAAARVESGGLAFGREPLEGFPRMASAEYKRRFRLVKYNSKWAVTMAKVGIRRAVAQAPFPRWEFVEFRGPHGGESRGVVDLIAIRKDHGQPPVGTKRGDALQIILIQVKGGDAAKPTAEDGKRLRVVARRHGACKAILATWKKGKAARFFSLRPKVSTGMRDWIEVDRSECDFRVNHGAPH